MKTKVLILVGLLVLATVAMVAPVAADDTTTNTTVVNSAPVISGVSITQDGNINSGNGAVNTNTSVSFTVTDDNSLNDLNYIKVEVYYDTQTEADSGRSYYQFLWTEGAGNTPFVDTPDGYWESNTVPSTEQELTNSFEYTVTFKLDKTAIASSSAHQWHVRITAQDDTAESSDVDADLNFDVNLYSDYSIDHDYIAFGTTDLGGALATQTRIVTVTANTQVDVSVEGENLLDGDLTETKEAHGTDDTLEVGGTIFTFVQGADTPTSDSAVSSDTNLTTSAQDVYSGAYETGCNLCGGGEEEGEIDGYSNAATWNINFGGAMPAVQPDGTYTGTWTFTVATASILNTEKY